MTPGGDGVLRRWIALYAGADIGDGWWTTRNRTSAGLNLDAYGI